jgi:hypothetical protein
MRNTFRRSLTLAVTCGFVLTLATPAPAAGVSERERLDALLVRYDREPDGPERTQLAAQIDAFAHQKYATVSRLYWYVDLASARAAARAQGRPILHLRMLGKLDEDLSCANSRLFRATLYANRNVSAFLRQHFVLYWSSERPVPRVTIDYGDGRVIERTITGNSAHYVLDEDGELLDVLPGLYAPGMFQQELERAAALAGRVRHQPAGERARLLADHHQQRLSAAEQDWERLGAMPGMSDLRQRLNPPRNATALIASERATMSKRAVEIKDVRRIARELARDLPSESELETWSAAGRILYGTGVAPVSSAVLDEASRALVVRLHQSSPPPWSSTSEALEAMIARLEQTIVADTALNQLQVRPQISREIVRRGGRVDFATLNAWIYDDVFRTPSQDPWLGLLPRDTFTGLPGDGVVLRSGTGRR